MLRWRKCISDINLGFVHGFEYHHYADYPENKPLVSPPSKPDPLSGFPIPGHSSSTWQFPPLHWHPRPSRPPLPPVPMTPASCLVSRLPFLATQSLFSAQSKTDSLKIIVRWNTFMCSIQYKFNTNIPEIHWTVWRIVNNNPTQGFPRFAHWRIFLPRSFLLLSAPRAPSAPPLALLWTCRTVPAFRSLHRPFLLPETLFPEDRTAPILLKGAV